MNVGNFFRFGNVSLKQPPKHEPVTFAGHKKHTAEDSFKTRAMAPTGTRQSNGSPDTVEDGGWI